MFPEDYSPRVLRKKYKCKQIDIANYLGITVRQYRTKEMKISQWYTHEIYLLAQFYGIQVDHFFKEKV